MPSLISGERSDGGQGQQGQVPANEKLRALEEELHQGDKDVAAMTAQMKSMAE